MYANLPFIAQVQEARRREAEREAERWRQARAPHPSTMARQALLGLWRRIRWFVWIRDQQTLRARLKEYAAR